MKIKSVATLLAVCSALVACSGGTGSPPVVTPTNLPTVNYAPKIVFIGALSAARSSQAITARAVFPMDATPAPSPVMVVEPPVSGVDSSVYGGQVIAEVSPMPSTSPQVTFAQTNSNAAFLATPSPGPSQTPQPLPTGAIAAVEVKGTNVVQGQASGTATATIGEPINQTVTTPVYSYMSIALDCVNGFGPGIAQGSFFPYQRHFGWKWNGTTWAADDDVTTADVYMDGGSNTGCSNINMAESGVFIHVPGGEVRVSTATSFAAISATQWSNAETSYAGGPAYINPDGSIQCIVIGKTHDGSHVFKWDAANAGCEYGAIETSGSSVDGF